MNRSKAIKEDLPPLLPERYARRQRAGKTRRLDALCDDYGGEHKQALKRLGDAVLEPPLRAGFSRPGTAVRPP